MFVVDSKLSIQKINGKLDGPIVKPEYYFFTEKLLSKIILNLNTNSISNLILIFIGDNYIKSIIKDIHVFITDKRIKLYHFAEKISNFPGILNFVFIGELVIKSQVGVKYNYFETFCRSYINSKNRCEVDIMFKDITETNIREIQIMDFNNKALFFSKIAYELKNPAICINETIN